ncbi:MAG: RagB/SusD family nutrient uptake outer membrane protein, partial [Halanaerobiales bacterium]|nr:RagB/SusD family nutrient uptake outer membrane protein [Halanaerobiales bacterium]
MKKNIQYKWFFGVLILCMLIACNDDFLERYPLDSMSDATFFTSANDLKAFTAGFYKQLPLYEHWENNKGLDHNTDMVIQQNPAENLMQQGASGQAADFEDVNKNWNRHWDWIRQFNYFLENAYKVSPMDAAARHYTGEGYFWRARRYYHMLVDYGDVPIIKEALNVDSEKLYKTRDSRYDVAKFIMEDLDSAIVN